MHLFTYLAGDRAVPGRQVGTLGIDIALAVQAFCRTYPSESLDFSFNPVSLLDWLGLKSEGLALIQKSTDWILEQYLNVEEASWQSGMVFELDTVSLLAPIPNPGKVICIAGNYPAPGKMERPEHPTVFLKPSSGVTGDNQPLVIPELAQNVAYEVELAVVIGSRGRHLSIENASNCIAGYTIANDVGDRILEKRTTQWTSGKLFDTFTPMGPVLVTPDDLKKTSDLKMVTKVNGQIVQQGSTAQMFFDVPQLISLLSELTTLLPGDVVLSGSPKLMGETPNPTVAIQPGDFVEVSIENLGTLSNPAFAEGQAV